MKKSNAHKTIRNKAKYFDENILKILEEEIRPASDTPSTSNSSKTTLSSTSIIIPEEVVMDILLQLESFETSNDYLKPDIKLNSLATSFNTNTKYLSKVINTTRKKSFSQYINSLRIAYLIEKLKQDKRYTNYTVKAIATEIGFKTANAFSKAFFKETGLQPSVYIKNLNP